MTLWTSECVPPLIHRAGVMRAIVEIAGAVQ